MESIIDHELFRIGIGLLSGITFIYISNFSQGSSKGNVDSSASAKKPKRVLRLFGVVTIGLTLLEIIFYIS